jgi:NADP-dependent 3-hydroxy acid dehydrogenase YdfG
MKKKLSLQIVLLDVNDDGYVREAIYKLEAENNRIYVLVNNEECGLWIS